MSLHAPAVPLSSRPGPHRAPRSAPSPSPRGSACPRRRRRSRRARQSERHQCEAARARVIARSRAARRARCGSPASSIARAASSIGYSTRRQVAFHVAVSSRSHAARGSPSRGWPTPPGLTSQLPPDRSSSAPASAVAPKTLPSSSRRNQSATCEWPTAATRGVHQVDALLRLPGREHVLPDRVARAGVVERGLPGRVGGGERSQVGHRVLADRLLRPAGGRRGAGGEVRDRDLTCDHQVVVPGERQVAPVAGELDALVRLRRRSPTRSPRHQTSSTASSSTSPSTASKAGRFPWTSDSRAMRIWGFYSVERWGVRGCRLRSS